MQTAGLLGVKEVLGHRASTVHKPRLCARGAVWPSKTEWSWSRTAGTVESGTRTVMAMIRILPEIKSTNALKSQGWLSDIEVREIRQTYSAMNNFCRTGAMTLEVVPSSCQSFGRFSVSNKSAFVPLILKPATPPFSPSGSGGCYVDADV